MTHLLLALLMDIVKGLSALGQAGLMLAAATWKLSPALLGGLLIYNKVKKK